jgi:hypothetical protein
MAVPSYSLIVPKILLRVDPLLGIDHETNMFHSNESMHSNRGTAEGSVFYMVYAKGYVRGTPAEIVSCESVCEERTRRLV